MKKWLLFLATFLILFPVHAQAATNENTEWYEITNEFIEEHINNLKTNEWTPYLKYINDEGVNFFENESVADGIKKLIAGEFTFSWDGLLNNLIRIFFNELNLNLVLMAKIIIIAVICGIFNSMKDSFQNSSVGEIGFFVCFSVVMVLIMQSFISILMTGKSSIDKMASFMQMLFPVLLGLLTSVGNFTSAAIMQPAVGLIVGIVGSVLTNFVFPFITLSAVITLVNQISDRIQLKNLGKLLNNLCIWTIAFIFTVFISVLAIQGALTASIDGISIRTAKFAVDTFVPIVGKMLSQSLETIVGCALLVKNAIGATGLIILTILCLIPTVKIFSLLIVYKLAGALLEPITDKRITESLNGIGNVISILLITILGIAVMFFMTIALLITTGNTVAMLR